MALKLNMDGKRNQRAGAEAPAPIGSAVEGLPGGLLRRGISSQRGACSLPAELIRRPADLDTVAFAEALAAEQEDLGVFHQAVGDGGGDGGVVEDVAPVGERCVSCNDSRALLAVAGGDDLIEEIRGLLIEGKIS